MTDKTKAERQQASREGERRRALRMQADLEERQHQIQNLKDKLSGMGFNWVEIELLTEHLK